MIRNCSFCEKELVRSEKPKNVFCNYTCKANWQKENLKGSNNPNFNNNWSDEQKKVQSIKVGEKMRTPELRYKSGTANKGKTFSVERRKNMAKGHIGIKWGNHSDKSKKIIGQKSSDKFTDEYLEKIQKQNYESGVWIHPNKKNDYKFYSELSNWVERMFEVAFDPDKKLKQFGVFNSKQNSKGVVRDHIFSRIDGFELKVFPELIRHPANCQILTHSENLSKRFKKGKHKILKDSNQTLEQLFLKIKTYTKPWIEQDLCLSLIESYENGKRYLKENYYENKTK